ncbi:uncharacterized protein LOC123549420 isoform X1 [Mercenaria mercenaria]|uniref:uncharacterized protein LOC123549420 isoform X1 n=1 Tax=Mercenaria mercenaria TaxID=6596 RepID=UPI00234E6EC6|nr:uncharacterized protein LOC123549420 isoform X1 [Mercenaria mercenaria]
MSENSVRFYRIISLVVDVGTQTLLDIFYSKVPKEDVSVLFGTREVKAEFIKLKGKNALTKVQYVKVTAANPDPDTYDISLLTTLLTCQTICGIPLAKKFPPVSSDLSVGADLHRLRELRNEIIGHRNNAQLEVTEFKKFWADVETVLIRLANHVGTEEETKIRQMIRDVETGPIEPLHDREKKLLQVFVQWQKEDIEKYQTKMTEVLNSLENLNIKVDNIKKPTDETDAVRSDSEDTLSSLQSQVVSLVESFGNIAKQDDVNHIQANLKNMGDTVQTLVHTMKTLQQQLDANNRNMEALTQKTQIAVHQPAPFMFERDGQHVSHPMGNKPKKPKIQSPNAMSEKEILDLSRQIGYEWEQLRIHLDFTEAQGHALKRAYDDDVQQRIHQMLKSWHDVVVECGENPKMLLAAAFVNASTNYAMAYKLVPKEKFNENAQAKPATVERIQQISFSKRGYDQGDGFYYHPGSGSSMPHGGPGSFNVYGGDVRVEGTVAIHSSHSNQSYNMNSVASDGLDGSGSSSTMSMPPSGSFNVFGGKVAMGAGSNFVIGPPGQSYPAQNFNPPVIRGETQAVQDSGASSMGSLKSAGQPFKKAVDDTLSQTMVLALHEQMKSVGVLISGGNLVGTVFRVGSRSVMTALHVINKIIDPSGTGAADVGQLESTDTYINFNESPLTPPMVPYRLMRNFIFSVDLDVAVLEISNPSNLPMKLNLSKTESGVTNVSLIGYGHPGQIKKCLDPKCEIVHPNSHRILSAQAWLQQNRDYFKSALHGIGRDPALVDKGYQGYDQSSKLIFDCYMEHGASGAPALTNDNERSVQVVGILTHGLPDFYFSLPELIKPQFPKNYRLEVGAKMKDIFDWINSQPEDIAKDLFN